MQLLYSIHLLSCRMLSFLTEIFWKKAFDNLFHQTKSRAIETKSAETSCLKQTRKLISLHQNEVNQLQSAARSNSSKIAWPCSQSHLLTLKKQSKEPKFTLLLKFHNSKQWRASERRTKNRLRLRSNEIQIGFRFILETIQLFASLDFNFSNSFRSFIVQMALRLSLVEHYNNIWDQMQIIWWSQGLSSWQLDVT